MCIRVIILVSLSCAPLGNSLAQSEGDSLRAAYAEKFDVGTALSIRQLLPPKEDVLSLVGRQFSVVTPENEMKWEKIHPEPGRYDFVGADALVDFAEKNGLKVVGHTLLWHSQCPDWVFQDDKGQPISREVLIERLRDHISTVVGRYRGRIQGWDVVNEAILDDGSWRDTKWREILGDDFIELAFRFAHEADPTAELYYNDFSMTEPGKRRRTAEIVQRLRAAGVPIHGVGEQGHWGLDYPTEKEIDDALADYSKLGLKVMITELDVDVLPRPDFYRGADVSHRSRMRAGLDPYRDGLPEEVQQRLAERYASIFRLLLKHSDAISRVTFWGVEDGQSWRNNWPVPGRTAYPLLFDRKLQPKPAYWSVLKVADEDPTTIRVANEYRNPVIPGDYPDPTICRVGEDYYLACSSFEYFPGVPIFHSRDLVNWRQIGHVLTRPSQLKLDGVRASGGIYAPTLRFHDGTFYLVTTNVGGGGNFYVTATDPAGPWSDPIWLDQEGIDPSLLFASDGKVYYTRHVGGGDGHIGQTTLDIKSGKLAGQPAKVWGGTGGQWAEGPHLFQHGDWWYLVISEGGTSYEHSITAARSRSPMGPFEADPTNPLLTHRDHPREPLQAIGHCDLVETPGGWWAVCLGFRPVRDRTHHLGRETMLLPVRWTEDGWLRLGSFGRVLTKGDGPHLPWTPWPAEPVRDDFDSLNPGLPWTFVRNPNPDDWSLAAKPGVLRLRCSPVTLDDQASPAFVARRLTGMSLRAATRLDFTPGSATEEAGLAIRMTDGWHYDAVVTRREGRRVALLRRVLGGKAVAVGQAVELADGPVEFSLTGTPTEYRFRVTDAAAKETELGVLAPQDIALESINNAGKGYFFTGARIGIFTTSNGKPSESSADFDWFDYEVLE